MIALDTITSRRTERRYQSTKELVDFCLGAAGKSTTKERAEALLNTAREYLANFRRTLDESDWIDYGLKIGFLNEKISFVKMVGDKR